MKICVCIKEVPDSDTPPDKLSIDKEKLKIFPTENISSTFFYQFIAVIRRLSSTLGGGQDATKWCH